MIVKDLIDSINALADDKQITYDQAYEAMIAGLVAGIKKSFAVKTARVDVNTDKNEIVFYKQYYVYDDAKIDSDLSTIEQTLISLSEAKQINVKAKVGEILEVKVSPSDFTLTGAKELKGKMNETITIFQKENVYSKFAALKDEMLLVKITDVEENVYRVEIDRELSAILPKKDCLSNELFNIGDRTRVLVTNVEMKTKWPKIYISRTSPDLVKRLFETYIPEIKEQIIEIVGFSREAGVKSKIGLRSNDPKMDPVGTAVGERGTRIQEIVKALSGEKIEVFAWSDNEQELISNALKPAIVKAVTKVNPIKKSALVIVPDDQLSLAIGKLGLNAKLAAYATGWHIDIRSESIASDEGIIY